MLYSIAKSWCIKTNKVMREKYFLKSIVLGSFFLLLVTNTGKAQCTYATSQSISAATFLACGSVTINAGVTLTVTGAVTINSNITVTDNGSLVFNNNLTLQNSGASLTVSGTGSMSIAGNVTVQQPFTDNVPTTVGGSFTEQNSGASFTTSSSLAIVGALSVNGTPFTVTSTGTVTAASLSLYNGGGSITDNGSISVSGNANTNGDVISGTGNLYAGGTISFTNAGASIFGSTTSCSMCTINSSGETCASLSGVYTVGGGGSPNFVSLTEAFSVIACGGLSGNVSLVLQSGYVSTVETFPLAPPAITSSYSVTIYEAVSGLSITSGNAVGTINLNGSKNYIFDGRVNATGSTVDMVIANTNTAGYVFQFINDATYNTLKYCNIEGVNTSTSSGDIYFNTANAVGNNNNTITYCNIHDGATTPYNCIYSSGTTALPNSNNIVSNNNIYNFFVAGTIGADGIDLEGGNTAWTISGNSFYQTAARVPTVSNGLAPIVIENNTGTDYVVTGNYIGGTAPNCGGTALTFDAGLTQDNYFTGIYLSVGAASASFIQNNTVANIAWGSKCQAAAANAIEFAAIIVSGGYVSVTNNTVGSTTGNGSITVSLATTSTQQYNFEGIFVTGTQGAVEYNNVGSITVSGGKTSKYIDIRALDCEGALVADFGIHDNIIGSTTTSNSIYYSGNTANEVTFNGIFISTTGAYYTNVFNNTIQNITNTGTAATTPLVTGAIAGIYSYGSSLCSITTNTFVNITTSVGATNTIMGIYSDNTTAGQTISDNYIYNLSNTYSGATSTDVNGIYYTGPTTGANVINGNAIYNLTLNSTSTASTIYGVRLASGIATTSNNMITLGNSVATNYGIYGIYDASNTATNYIYFNSVYIGGTAGAGAINTACYYSSVTANRTVENNIFYNARTGGTGEHYSIDVSSKTGLTSNYNDLFSATDVGAIGGTNYVTLANWKTGATQDANSISSNPSFVSPTTAAPNLHINAGSPVIGVGLNGTGIVTDFDNNERNNPPSIGADEEHTEYYSKSTGSLDVLATWGTNTDGSGTSPLNFTSNQCTYNIRNNPAPTLGVTNWVVSGTGSNIVLGDGTNPYNLTIPAAYSCTGTVNIANNATLTIQNSTVPTLNVMGETSTVNYAASVAQTIQAGTYGNLIISNISNASPMITKPSAGNIYIAGNLTIGAYTVFDITTYFANRTGGGGLLSIAAYGKLRLSGTTSGASASNNFPNNFASYSLTTGDTIEYYGTTQTIYDVPPYDCLTITTSGTKTPEGNLTIANLFKINSPATFAASTFTHNFKGNFLNNGTFTANTSTAIFSGSTAQTISGSSVTTFDNLTLNNATGLTLSTPANISAVLALTAGLLNTSSADSLTMLVGSTTPVLTTASTSYVNGPLNVQKNTMASQTLNFPIGAAGDCRPISLTVSHSTTSTFNYVAKLYAGNSFSAGGANTYTNYPATVDTLSGVHYYSIHRYDATPVYQSTLSLSSAAITINFGTDDQVYNGSLLTICKTYTNNTDWIDIGQSTCSLGTNTYTAAQGGSITSNNFTSFSYFALGRKNGTGKDPLPIELLSFNAIPNGDKVDIKWETVSESNNKYFTIEKSSDGMHFTKVMDHPGAGNSTSYRNYAETDYQPYSGISYYRLKQTDFNGNFNYFNMVPVNFEKQTSLTLYPNPISTTQPLNISTQGYQNDQVLVVLSDMQGNEFFSKVLVSTENNQIFALNETSTLAPGCYIVTASSNNKIYNYKLIVK